MDISSSVSSMSNGTNCNVPLATGSEVGVPGLSVAPEFLREQLANDLRGDADTIRSVESEGLSSVRDMNEIGATVFRA